MKKTWVKVKRGLLIDPKHRMDLGNRIWLYLYMLDVADWDTGKVIEWRDRCAADDLQMPISTIRTQRREIEEAGYISCRQHHSHQVITIKRWVNPREYSGKVYNDDEGDQNYAPQEIDEKTEGVNESNNEGVNEGTQNLTLLHINHISQSTGHKDSSPVGDPEYIDVGKEFEEPKKKSLKQEHQAMFKAIMDVTETDINIGVNAGRINKASKELREAGYTPDDVIAFKDSWKQDWRYRKDRQPPSIAVVHSEIKKVEPKVDGEVEAAAVRRRMRESLIAQGIDLSKHPEIRMD